MPIDRAILEQHLTMAERGTSRKASNTLLVSANSSQNLNATVMAQFQPRNFWFNSRNCKPCTLPTATVSDESLGLPDTATVLSARNQFQQLSVSSESEQEECIMKLGVVLATSLLVAATTVFAREPTPQTNTSTVQGVTSQAPSLADETTGPTKPRAPVQSPEWV
jgi:hypothetical protein